MDTADITEDELNAQLDAYFRDLQPLFKGWYIQRFGFSVSEAEVESVGDDAVRVYFWSRSGVEGACFSDELGALDDAIFEIRELYSPAQVVAVINARGLEASRQILAVPQ